MAFDSAHNIRGGGGIIGTLASIDGSASHRLPRALASRQSAMRDLADAAHALCALHGGHPGVIDHAARHNGQPAAQPWLDAAAHAFAGERAYLAQLTAAAGPLPSTPGQAQSQAAGLAQRHALDMLAQSSRTGCATGAALALALDWLTIRATLDSAAQRFGITPPESLLPIAAETATIAASLYDTPGVERAMAFGAQQLLAQHRGLWDLLEARACARDAL